MSPVTKSCAMCGVTDLLTRLEIASNQHHEVMFWHKGGCVKRLSTLLAERDVELTAFREENERLNRVCRDLMVSLDDLTGPDPFCASAPDGNDYRTGYGDGLRWASRRLRRLLKYRTTRESEADTGPRIRSGIGRSAMGGRRRAGGVE